MNLAAGYSCRYITDIGAVSASDNFRIPNRTLSRAFLLNLARTRGWVMGLSTGASTRLWTSDGRLCRLMRLLG